MTVSGGGTWTLTGSNTYTGLTTVNAGTIGGTGTTGAALLVNSGGTLAPGDTTGIFSTKTNLTFAVGSTLALDLAHGAGASPVAGTDYDQVKVGTGTGTTSTGGITLNGGTLALTIGAGVRTDDIFFVILNDGTDVITGTFTGLAQGAQFSVSGQLFRVSYTADSTTLAESGGNDVALIAVPEPGAPLLALAGLAAFFRGFRCGGASRGKV